MTRIDDAELKHIYERVANAAPGPWHYEEITGHIYCADEPGNDLVAADVREDSKEFLEHARDDMTALLLYVESLRLAIREAIAVFEIEVSQGDSTIGTMRRVVGLPHTWNPNTSEWE